VAQGEPGFRLNHREQISDMQVAIEFGSANQN
jgi:hypothetical protein